MLPFVMFLQNYIYFLSCDSIGLEGYSSGTSALANFYFHEGRFVFSCCPDTAWVSAVHAPEQAKVFEAARADICLQSK